MNESTETIKQTAHAVRHRILLFTSLFIIVSAFLLEVRDDRVSFGRGTGSTLPHLCAIRGWLGIDCPACGLTRSLIHFSNGDWRASLADHRLGWLIALAVVVQIPYRCHALKTGQNEPLGHKVPMIYWNGLIVLLMADWIAGFAINSVG